MEIARKAALAELIHNKTFALLEEELIVYNMSHLILQAFVEHDYQDTLLRDSQIKEFVEKQEQEIFRLKVDGMLLYRVRSLPPSPPHSVWMIFFSIVKFIVDYGIYNFENIWKRDTLFFNRQKYNRKRHALLNQFQTKFLRSLQSTGFQIPTLEAHLTKELVFFQGIPEQHLVDMEKQSDIFATEGFGLECAL